MQTLNLYIFIFFAIWLLVLSYFYYRFLSNYRKLTRGIDVGDIKKVLEKILGRSEDNTKSIKEIIKRIDSIEEKDKKHIQKIGLVRFNPFSELGGDHSFSLAILDEENTGVIVTGLHTRDRTRVYVKDIKNGKSGLELSSEEKKALGTAQKGYNKKIRYFGNCVEI